MSWEVPGAGRPGRAGREAAFLESMRRMGSLMQLTNQAAAERVGLNSTDLNCLNILSLSGQMTAGQLAKATGLTTASITGVLDRLEEAGYVRRERDPSDRRRVVIQLIMGPVMRDVAMVFAPVVAAWRELAKGYSDAELELVIGLQIRIVRVLSENLDRLRARDAAGQSG